MGNMPAGDMLLEVQRTLPSLYSNMRIMSTLGIVSGSSGRGLCHFDLEGYEKVAQLMSPLVEQDNYGLARTKVLSAPNLKRAYFSSAIRNEITMEFDQPMAWKEECSAWIYLDGVSAPVSAGKAAGNAITLQLSAPSTAKTIAYLSGQTWDGRPDKRWIRSIFSPYCCVTSEIQAIWDEPRCRARRVMIYRAMPRSSAQRS